MIPDPRIDIRALTQEEVIGFFKEIGEPKYRASQVYQWLWQKSVKDFDSMTNLSLALREKLKEKFIIRELSISSQQLSNDGTVKYAFRMHDGMIVEGVLIPTEKRMTACISSQVGCSLACEFCATGKLKRMRNLAYSEIYDQVVAIDVEARERYGKGLTNIVYMGMGEPLLNYKNVMESVAKITGEDSLHMSSKRITISTAGLAKQIRQIADDEAKFNLALSLHAANDEKRSKMMAINDANGLDTLADALNYYCDKSGRIVTFEYIIFKDLNDSIEDAKELLAFCKRVPSKVNIIEYNSVEGTSFQKAAEAKVDKFAHYLESRGVVAKVRRSRGKDIDAACGQLANKEA